MQNKPTKSEYFAFLYIVFVILLNSYAAHFSPEKGGDSEGLFTSNSGCNR